MTCSNPILYGCGLCSPTHCADVLPDSADPDTASSVRAIMNWRCGMIYSPHGPVMYSPANMPLGPKRVPTAYQSHLNVISLLHPGPGPDCPLTRIHGLELMSTLASHPARGQTPLLRADVIPISRSLLDRSHPLLRPRSLSPPRRCDRRDEADLPRGGCTGTFRMGLVGAAW